MKVARFAMNGRVYEGRFESGQLVVPHAGVFDAEEVVWLPPVAYCSKMIGLALNYSDHAAELNLQLPAAPVLFNKNPNTLIGHKGQVIAPDNVEYMHYENELVVVIGRRCRRVKAEQADQVIQGYTIGNDVTVRDFINNWYRPPVKAKGFDTFGPLGPVLVTTDDLADPGCLELRTYVNGEMRQEGNTCNFIYSIPELVEYITGFMTLEPGDMLWTGTPKGISPVRPGDIMRLEIDKIGALVNAVVAETAAVP